MTNLEIKKASEFKQMNAEDLLKKINETYNAMGLRTCFFFNGKPFSVAREVITDEDESVILFKAVTNSLQANFVSRFWDGEAKKAEKVMKSKVVGYEIVDVYESKKYVGSYKNIVIK